MKLLIFGATSTVGKELVRQGLDAGHQITAVTRDKDKLDINHPSLAVKQGDVLNYDDVKNVMNGYDAVFCSLGAGRKGGVRAEGTRNIVKAMEENHVRRFICQTTLGCGDSQESLNFLWKYIMFGWLLKEAFLDHELQEKTVFESSLDWTIVRPGAFTDGQLSKTYRHGFKPGDKTLKLKISRADVAHFMLEQLSTTNYLRKTPGLSY